MEIQIIPFNKHRIHGWQYNNKDWRYGEFDVEISHTDEPDDTQMVRVRVKVAGLVAYDENNDVDQEQTELNVYAAVKTAVQELRELPDIAFTKDPYFENLPSDKYPL